MKKHNLRCNYCGSDNYISKFFLLLRLIIRGKVYVTCKSCGYTSSYVLVEHIVHDTVDVGEKEFNKQFNDEQFRIFRRG